MSYISGKIPEGKGMFIWLVPRLVDRFGSHDAVAQSLKDIGITWVAVKMAEGRLVGDGYQSEADFLLNMDLFSTAMMNAGIELHSWAFNYGETTPYRRLYNWNDKEIAAIMAMIRRYKPLSHMVNAESHFKGQDPKHARSLMIELDAAKSATPETDIPIGFSSYKYPSSHDIPWSEFLSRSDFYSPQVYWQGRTTLSAPVEELNRSLDGWLSYGNKPVVAAGTMYPEGSWYPTAEQVFAFSQACKDDLRVQGILFWEWEYPWKYANEMPGVIDAYEAFKWETAPPPPPGVVIIELSKEWVAQFKATEAAYRAMIDELLAKMQ